MSERGILQFCDPKEAKILDYMLFVRASSVYGVRAPKFVDRVKRLI